MIYFLTAYRDSDILKRPNPLSTSISIDTRLIPEIPGAPDCKVNPKSYFRVRDYLYAFLISLRKSGKCPLLNNLTPDKMANEFKESFGLYARGVWPFNGWTSAIPLLEWWKHIGEAYPHTGVLVVSALPLCTSLPSMHNSRFINLPVLSALQPSFSRQLRTLWLKNELYQ